MAFACFLKLNEIFKKTFINIDFSSRFLGRHFQENYEERVQELLRKESSNEEILIRPILF